MVSKVVSILPDVMSGTPVFPGTRVPIQALLDCLEIGDTIQDFLDSYPTVTRDQVIQVFAGRRKETPSGSVRIK